MVKASTTLISYLVLLGFFVTSSPLAYSSSLPKSTMEMLKRNKLDPVILADIEKELQVPQQWIEQAKKEGKLRIRAPSNWGRWANVALAPFRERYPFIDLEFTATSTESRVVKTLMAYKRGRVIGDVIVSVGGKNIKGFKEADALLDIRSLPGLQNSVPEARDPEGFWLAFGPNVYCMAYNTNLVQVRDLPSKWEDLLVDPAWKNGNLALPNRPEVWVPSLWKAKGERWTKEFLVKLFSEVEPQTRKEGLTSMVQLLAAGEFHAVIPASNSATYGIALEGAPINFWCPDLALFYISTMVALKGPNTHAAKIYLNWVLSKEGQIAQQIDRGGNPIHKQLQRKEFFPFAEQFLGKQRIFTDTSAVERVMRELLPFWSNLWLRER